MASTLRQATTQHHPEGAHPPILGGLLAAHRVQHRPGQLTILAGQPGAGKTFLMINIMLYMGVRALCISADSDEQTMSVRLAANLSGDTTDRVENAFANGQGGYYLDLIEANTGNMRFTFDAAITIDDIILETDAMAELYGAYPEMIVVDNLMNVVPDSGDEYGGMREVMKALHYLARETGSSVWVLHHTSEDWRYPSDTPSPRGALHGKVAQLPSTIITIALAGRSLGLAVVKNRFGPADPKAEHPVWCTVDLARMSLIL